MSAAGKRIGQNDAFEVLAGAAVVAVAVVFLAFTYMRTGSGSLSRTGVRPPATGDYQAWQPE